jgi:beta-xylosidase/lysophospholipase L1-like esterase
MNPKIKILSLAFVIMMLLSTTGRPVHVFMAGDSTMADKVFYKNVTDSLTGEITPEVFLESGWGQLLPEFFNDKIMIKNLAQNGRSTKTFRAEGWWGKIMSNVQKDDYVIIQFGHNDSSIEKKDRYTTPDEYKANLFRFIDEVKAKGANPILCTPVARRKFDTSGMLIDTHGVYPDIVRDVAKDKKVFLIDMQKQTSEWLTAEGVAKSKKYFHKLAPGVSKLFPKGLDDNTHFNENGARIVAGFFVEGLKAKKVAGLTKELKENVQPYISQVWVPDLANGKYKNPVLYADYSDPDVCRVGNDYYMVASSFANTPGLPILHSNDLVNWTLVSYAIQNITPETRFNTIKHGKGVWAPSIRYHNNEFYIYFGDPDAGIYMTKANKVTDIWSPLCLVKEGKGLIDACPFWDENGRGYVVHGFAGSRAGMKSMLAIFEMSPDGKTTLTNDRLVFDGHPDQTTIEGPKFYKRNGYYYIFAPAGGVKTGWQVALRSTNIYGPYNDKIVLAQGKSDINGPHQGAWIDTPDGKQDWFMHFQDLYAYGRAVLLQPMRWINDWPVMGEDKDGDGCGTPVAVYQKPNVGKNYPMATPIENDEFDGRILGLQWQWQANSNPLWYFPAGEKGYLRLFAWETIGNAKNLWDAPALLLQKFPAPNFKATTKLTFTPFKNAERAGLVIMGLDYAAITIENTDKGLTLNYVSCKNAPEGSTEINQLLVPTTENTIYFRVEVKQTKVLNSENILQPIANCTFSYSFNGKTFTTVGSSFEALEGKWIGAKVGVFCQRPKSLNDSGYADIDWFRIEK